jgi:hypothetical protein
VLRVRGLRQAAELLRLGGAIEMLPGVSALALVRGEPGDASTGATKREHAGRILESEVGRARRYCRSLALVVVGPDAWEPPNNARLA